jgi:Predicted ATPase
MMVKVTTKITTRVELLADNILAYFKNVQPGHCARVDFLSTTEASAICQTINERQQNNIAAYVLTKQGMQQSTIANTITVDKAIELRNRKQETLCLFIPSDLVDAAYSSLANSFAIIDGRTIHTRALRQVRAQLPARAEQFVRATFHQLRGMFSVSDDQKLDFAIAVLQRAEAAEMDQAGLELWRVGLISDATVGRLADNTITLELENKLEQNRRGTATLARPAKIDAPTRERVQTLKVDEQTARQLALFFRGRSLNDARSWSQALTEQEELTFDRWLFPASEASDIRSITIASFVNAKGEVEKRCKLLQPDGPKGSLFANCAPKGKMAVHWQCDPIQPSNLGGWRVAIIPSNSDPSNSDIEYEGSIELPERDLLAQRRNVTLNMDIEFTEPPDFAVCVRVTAINKDGTAIVDDKGAEIHDDSMEFYLSKDMQEPVKQSGGPSKSVVANLAYGRLAYAVSVKDTALNETDPQWSSKELEYFNIKLNNRRLLQVGVSETLLTLERRSIAEPRNQCSYVLDVDDVHAVSEAEIVAHPLSNDEDDWSPFWRTRELFFSRLKKSVPRDIIEVAEWNPEIINAALRYVQAYKELLEDLLERQGDPRSLRAALSIDSILVRITGRQDIKEEAIVTLPIHPLRVAWLVNYTELLHKWEDNILLLPEGKRKYNLDLQALGLLTPINVPPFSYHMDTDTTFTFFQNLRFFHGVALPADVIDPHRRYGDIAQIFGMAVDQGEYGATHPEQLAAHLKSFLDLHQYAHTLVTTLVNPDRGDFFAEAIKQLLPEHKPNEDEESQKEAPTFQITAYADSRHKSTLQAIEQIRQLQLDQQQYKQATDHFLPGIMTTLRKIEQLHKSKRLPEAHIAVVTDLTQPKIQALALTEQTVPETASFSLYGLVNRFNSQFSAADDTLRWQHRIVTEGVRKPEAHPTSPRYSDLLIELQTTLLTAGGYLLSGTLKTQPVLEVTLASEQRELLERLHASTNWVITLDRFFTLDYYDSPNEPGLASLARKYVLDYSPEFTDGLGHRMMVTTAWHEEIQSLLSQAMNELGFARVDQSVSNLLHHLKTISGRLALQALESPATAATAVSIGVVTAWLQQKGRMRQAVLIPVDTYPRLFSLDSSGKIAPGDQRCDLVLVSLRRNIVEATFIDVKWRRGQVPFEDLAQVMTLQMKSSAKIMENRFFNEQRVDGALQRSYLANVLRFYFERSRRYKLFDPEAEASFLEHVSRLEKTGLDFRNKYEGYIVSLEGDERKPFSIDDARITVLTARDFEQTTGFATQINTPATLDDMEGDLIILPDDEEGEDEEEPAIRQEREGKDYTEWQTGTDASDVASQNGQDYAASGDITAKLPALPRGDQYGEEQAQEVLNTDSAEERLAEPPEEEMAASGIPLAARNTAPVVIGLGTAVGADVEVEWKPSVSGSPHLFVLGMPGQGKSWAVTRLLTELGKQEVPALVLDFHGQFADPAEPFVQVAHPAVLDAARGLPFSPFECTQDAGAGGWLANSYAIAEIFAHVAELGDMQRDIVFSAVRDAYKAHGYSDDPDQVNDGLTYPSLAEVLQNIEELARERHSPNVAARCRPLLEMNLFRPVEDAPDLLSLVRSGLVIDLHNLYVETLQQAAGAFVLRKLYKDMFSWGYAKRIRLAIVLDEAHRLAKDVTLPKIMREGRKFGIAVVVASQGLADFHPDVLGTAGTKVIFRMNFPESKKVAGFIRGLPGQDLSARIERLSVGTAYVQTPEMSVGSVVQMHPLKL